MYFGRKFSPFNLLLRVLPYLTVQTNTASAAAAISKDAAENWIPSDEFSNTSSINWYERKHDEDIKTTKSLGRNFQDDDDESAIDRAFNEFVSFSSDDFKAIPFQLPNGAELISTSGGGNTGTAHLHSTIFQQPQSSLAKPFYPAPASPSPPYPAAASPSSPYSAPAAQSSPYSAPAPQSSPYSAPAPQSSPYSAPASQSSPYSASAAQSSPYSPNAAAAVAISSVLSHTQSAPSSPYTSNAFQSPFQAPHSQNLENFDYQPPTSYPPSNAYLPPAPYPTRFVDNSTNNLELNTRHLLYLQPGKCSNSIEVGRLRDLEIKSTVKTTTPDIQKSVCVLMLYSANENNKLAISMQSAIETPSAEIATENWLQRNIKVYSLQGGTITRTSTDANFGPGSPALILTKSSIVLLSILADRTLDFQIDISTYQSKNC